ncbi:MAG: cytochrome c maturation protein CcmE [Candidatus Thorarchaeota archaeon]|nr:MAG: cytochrome c maturation protein CcmE [Candidatus Thorarchaeota archaeon]
MAKKKTKVLVIAAILLVTVSFVAYGMLTLFVDPYLGVDLVVENPENYMGRTIQVKGKLQAGSINIGAENTTLVMYGDTHTITVLVEGQLPNLVDDQDMVAVGVLEVGNIIRASQLLAQCPSKYEATTTTTP